MSKQCKDCVHYNVCEEWADRTNHAYYQYGSYCEHFKDKSRIVEIPCDVGDWLYLPCCGEIIELQVFEIQIKHIFVDYNTGVIKNIIALNENGASMELKFKDIGKTVFLTREEAEKA